MEQGPRVIDWKGLLLIAGLWLVIFLPLDLAIRWLADRWDLTVLQVRSSRYDAGTLLAGALGIAIASTLSGTLGFTAVTRPAKLDSEPPLP